MDGTTAGNGTGPRIMKPVQKDVILASADQVAIDAVAARIMGFDPMAIRYIALAHEAGLGVGRPEEIEIVGDVDAARENWHFEVGRCFHQFAAWVTWFGPTRFLQDVLTRPPILLSRELLLVLLPRRPALALAGASRLRALAAGVGMGPRVRELRAGAARGQRRQGLINQPATAGPASPGLPAPSRTAPPSGRSR